MTISNKKHLSFFTLLLATNHLHAMENPPQLSETKSNREAERASALYKINMLQKNLKKYQYGFGFIFKAHELALNNIETYSTYTDDFFDDLKEEVLKSQSYTDTAIITLYKHQYDREIAGIFENPEYINQCQSKLLTKVIRYCDEQKCPLIISAITHDNAEATRRLLQHGANVNACNQCGHTALITIAQHHRFDIESDSESQRENSMQILRDLLAAKADPTIGTKDLILELHQRPHEMVNITSKPILQALLEKYYYSYKEQKALDRMITLTAQLPSSMHTHIHRYLDSLNK